jgi:hypothetical protein
MHEDSECLPKKGLPPNRVRSRFREKELNARRGSMLCGKHTRQAAVAAGLVIVALAAASPVSAERLSPNERAMLRDESKAAEVVGQRLQQARDLIASVPADPDQSGGAKKSSGRIRRIEHELAKAQAAFDGGDYRAAYVFANRAARLAAQAAPEVRR